jgi:hypothetical protein
MAIAVAYAATTELTAAAIEVATSVAVSDSSDSTAASNWRELVFKNQSFVNSMAGQIISWISEVWYLIFVGVLSSMIEARGLSYKTFYRRNLRLFVIS